jgi:hypothetical protein
MLLPTCLQVSAALYQLDFKQSLMRSGLVSLREGAAAGAAALKPGRKI